MKKKKLLGKENFQLKLKNSCKSCAKKYLHFPTIKRPLSQSNYQTKYPCIIFIVDFDWVLSSFLNSWCLSYCNFFEIQRIFQKGVVSGAFSSFYGLTGFKEFFHPLELWFLIFFKASCLRSIAYRTSRAFNLFFRKLLWKKHSNLFKENQSHKFLSF